MKLGRKYAEAKLKQTIATYTQLGADQKQKALDWINKQFPNAKPICPYCKEQSANIPEYLTHLETHRGTHFI